MVLAEEQTAGQGRHGHAWHSEPASGYLLLASCSSPRPVLTLALGLAARRPSREATGLACDLRWPNDLMLGGKKVAGILVQLVDGKAIAGIGINVNHDVVPAGTGGRGHLAAASTAGTTGLARGDPAGAAAGHRPPSSNWTRRPFCGSSREASSYAARPARDGASSRTASIEGITAGLDPAGFLIVRKDDGTDTLILAGGVRAAGS